MRALMVSILLLMTAVRGVAGEALAAFTKNGVAVEIRLEPGTGDQATLVGRLTPQSDGDALHLYAIDHVGETGIPTRLAIAPGEEAVATGPLTADKPGQDKVFEALGGKLRIYPPGPVEVRLPIRLPPGAPGGSAEVTLHISYMACTEELCLQPARKEPVVVQLPTAPSSAAAPGGGLSADDVRALLAEQSEALLLQVRTDVAKQLEELSQPARIRWRRPSTRVEAEALIAEAHAAGKAALVDFTGPSCNVCQNMAKTVFRLKPVIAAWNAQVPIEIDTDSHSDLAQWQQERFKTQNRPLYVRIAADGSETRWSQPFDADDEATLEKFLAFLAGTGAGADIGTSSDLGGFLLLALLGGLFTLVMPCTYPMIPFTINFFSKQAASGHRVVPLAAFYAVGIIACFVGLGVVVTGVIGSSLATVSGSPVTNLVIGALFIVLGLSLLGAFLLRLPSSLENALGGGRSGYIGALVMGLTFAVTAFACTAPFAGSVLAAAVADNTGNAWARAIGGMAIYASVVAVPFFLLAISPGLLARLPRASGWMNEFKIVGGLVEIAAALKFLVISDHHWHWGVFTRTSVVAAWAALALVTAAYIFGRWRTASDEPVAQIGIARVLIGTLTLAVALWLTAGLFGADLAVLESFFPE
ncbi:MAG TPA: cytochrome c biogenesis protein CcdA [Planctomycetota bacterium]|nr:cytochrome c biogenesis protein CcdA [Planctomycetota bacterium]